MVAIDERQIKRKSRDKTTLAEMTQQVNAMIGEYFNLHSLSIDAERVSNTKEASKAFSAIIQL